MRRHVLRLEDFTEAEMVLITVAEVPAGYAHLDRELEGHAAETPRQGAKEEPAGTAASPQPD